MPNNTSSEIDWFSLCFYILLILVFSYQAWMNLIEKKVSKFSLDALAVFLGTSLGSKKSRQRVDELSRNPKRIFLSGIYAILFVISSIYALFEWFKGLSINVHP